MADIGAVIGLCSKAYIFRGTDMRGHLVLDARLGESRACGMSEQFDQFDQPLILILENDDLTREGLALMARDAGYEAAIFKSFADARAAEGMAESICAIISDFDLGQGPNGVEAAQALRADREPVPPVLIVTGTRHRHVEAAARAAGFEIASKPASPSFLRRWLAQHAVGARSPAPLP
jgi:DNA-binding response OmpR family regulator